MLSGKTAAGKVACSVLSEVATFEELSDLLHELLTTYAIDASLTTRTFAAQAISNVSLKYAPELLLLLSSGFTHFVILLRIYL